MKSNFIKILSAVIMLSTTMCSSVSAQNEEGVESKSEYQEYLSPIRAGVPNEVPFWNQAAHQFMYAPSFDFSEVKKAVKYRFTVKAATADEISRLVKCASEKSIPLTFRAAGTSLSGQAISDSVLITLTANWRKINVQNNGELISLQPGVIGDVTNRSLKPFGRKIGPDPASIKAAIITVMLLKVNLPCVLRQLAKVQYNGDALFLLVN